MLFNNPILFLKYFRKQILEFFLNLRVPKTPSLVIRKKIDGVIFPLDFQNPPETKTFLNQMRFGFYEIETVECMKKFLHPGDIFIDVGANIGYFSAIGASLVGKNGRVYSFEPVPELFGILCQFVALNPGYKIKINNFALGEKEERGIIEYPGFPHSGGSSMIKGFVLGYANQIKERIEVRVTRLDAYIKKEGIENLIKLIKIDVEGYEFPVLKGLQHYFEDTSYRPPIICEIVPSVYPLLSTTLNQLVSYMRLYGYEAYNIYNPAHKIDITKFKEGAINVVWKVGS